VTQLDDFVQLIATGLMQGIDVFGRDLRCFAHALGKPFAVGASGDGNS
jgi:hypothetical protein